MGWGGGGVGWRERGGGGIVGEVCMECVSMVHRCVRVGRDEESERLGGIYMCGEVKSKVNKVK